MALKVTLVILSPFVLIFSIMWGYVFYSYKYFFRSNLNIPQEEIRISKEENILNKYGRCNFAGWAKTHHHFNLNIEDSSYSYSMNHLIHKFRTKKWETLTFTSQEYIFLIHLYDYKYSGGYSLDIVDIRDDDNTKFLVKKSYSTTLFNKPFINMTCKTDDCQALSYSVVRSETDLFEITYNKTKLNNHKINLRFRDAEFNLSINANLVFRNQGDNIVSVSPILPKKNYFTFSSKTQLMVPKGRILLNEKPLVGEDFLVTYSANRGVYPAKNKFVWANGNGVVPDNKKKIGLNFGYGLQHFNKSRHTEDAFFIEGKIYKLNAVLSEPPYDDIEKFSEWSFYNYDNDFLDKGLNYCDVVFITTLKDIQTFNFLGLRSSLVKQFGYFSGMCKDSTGIEYKFNKLYGVIETKDFVW